MKRKSAKLYPAMATKTLNVSDMKKRAAKKERAVEYVDKKRQFANKGEAKDLSPGKSIDALRQKYLGAGTDSKAAKSSQKSNAKIQVKLIRRKETGQDSDYTVQERTVIMDNGKIIGEQG